MEVLDHLVKPTDDITEISRMVKNWGSVVISLPLENSLQRHSIVCFKFTKTKPFSNNMRDTVIKRVPITKTPDYNYFGGVGSYHTIYRILKRNCKPLCKRYTALGFRRAINLYGIHILKKIFNRIIPPSRV